MTTRSLPGLVIVFLLTGVNAAAQNSLPWSSAYTDVTWTGGGIADGVEGSLVVPLLADESEWLFADLRGKTFDNASHEGNWGIGYRHWTDSDWIIGGYGFYDLRETPFDNRFWQTTLGLEAKNYVWDFRANGYIAEDGAKGTRTGSAVLSGGTILVRGGQERAYSGFDGEVGRLLWNSYDGLLSPSYRAAGNLPRIDAELRLFAGGFYFDDNAPGFPEIAGPRGRLELRLFDLPWLGNGSRLTLGAAVQHDGVRGTQGLASILVRVPLGRRNQRRMSPMTRRMVDPIVRDIDIVTNAPAAAEEPALNPRTGQMIGSVLTVDGNTAAPETVISGAGANSLVIADGSAGTITFGSTTDMPAGQTILGGGSQLRVVGANSGTAATFTAPGSRGRFETGGNFDAIRTSDNAGILGVDIATSGANADAVEIDDNNVLLEDVNITTTGVFARGIVASGTNQFTANSSSISASGSFAAAIFLDDNTRFTLNSSTITTDGSDGDGIDSNGNSQFTVNNSTITTNGSAPGIFGANGIDSDDNSRFTVNNTQITTAGTGAAAIFAQKNSRFTISGGSITMAQGNSPGIRAVSSSGRTITFLLSGVTINSADDGVTLDGDLFDAGTINATITGSTINAGTGVGHNEIDALANGSATQNLNVFNNALDGGAGTINLNEIGATSVINVTQPSAAQLGTLNGIPAGNVTTGGTVSFNQPAPPTP